MTPDFLIEARGLVRAYNGRPALRGIDLSVRHGELVGLVGPDGAGKSTTMHCLAGLLRPTAGVVRVLGDDPLAPRGRARERLGLMPQQYSLYGDLSVEENLRFFARLFGLSTRAYQERGAALLAITRLARFAERRADALSGGMYKKLALACALLHRPSVLLMDEPTNGVDPVSRRELWELIYALVHDGMSVLVSTAYMDEAARCHRVALLHEGNIIASGAPDELARALEYEVVELTRTGDHTLEASITEFPGVVSVTPCGETLRVLLAPAGFARLLAARPALGAHVKRVAPNFEDVFLARVSAQRAEAA